MKFIPTSDIIDKAKPKTELEVFGRMLRLKWFFPKLRKKKKNSTAWKVSKNGVIFGRYFPVFSPNTRKYGPEITL